MDLLIVPVPLFNKDMAVKAYYFRHQKGNDILDVVRGVGSDLDGAMFSPPLEMLNMVGIEAFTMGKPIFIPIDNYMALTRLELQTNQPPEKIIFLLDGTIKMEDAYIQNLIRLKELGFRFGIQKIDQAEPYKPILKICDYIFFDMRILGQPVQTQLYKDIAANYSHLSAVYTHISDMELFNTLKGRLQGLFEGRFYRTPVTKGRHEVSALQVNQLNLINLVQDENFEFSSVTRIIERDPKITVDLLRLVNSPYYGHRYKIKSINQAVTMLGQDEARKWITTAVAKQLGVEKPGELTRLSLVRAKFCESIAEKFHLKEDAQSLYLLGLFSVLDAILELPMDEALKMVHVSDAITEALVEQKGEYYPVYDFLLQYETASWKTVCRTLILNDIKTEDVYNAYVEALCWYRDLIAEA